MVPAWRKALAERGGPDLNKTISVAVFAPGVWKKRQRLQALLGPDVRFQFGRTSGADAVAGWGQKGGGQDHAARASLPYLALEDSFLSRLGENDVPYGLLGLIADPIGIYYDASVPSLCEQLIASSAEHDAADHVHDFRAFFHRHGLGKFNHFTPPTPPVPYKAIVVDQISGDLSIPGGQATADDFSIMLEAALDENGADSVAVKLHPYDGAGGRVGHLREAAERYNLPMISNRSNWVRSLEGTERVYVVSSNAGLEALIAGVEVSCFGVPFYGNWGLTDDRQSLARRTARPSLPQLIDAVYNQYASSWLPGLQRQGSALELAKFIVAQQRHANELGALTIAGLQRLKTHHVRHFSGPAVKEIKVAPSVRASVPAVWASRVSKDPALENHWRARERLFVEDGFIRSSGLGADLIRPLSLVFDKRGIYYDPSISSDLEHALENDNLAPDQLRRSRSLLHSLRALNVSKYNLSGPPPDIRANGKNVILVPGQVANDASVTKGAGQVRTNLQLLEAVRAARPKDYIVYKPHPDVLQAGREGHIEDANKFADQVLGNTNSVEAIAAADEVHTMTSLLGFEALVREKKVVCYGLPFYAGWGLTKDMTSTPRRTRTRTLDELVYFALIHYPYYINPRTNLPDTVESTIESLAGLQTQRPTIPGGRTALRAWRKAKTLPDYFRR